jgi:hypothetical protein
VTNLNANSLTVFSNYILWDTSIRRNISLNVWLSNEYKKVEEYALKEIVPYPKMKDEWRSIESKERFR